MNISEYPHEEAKRAIAAGYITKPDRCSECSRLREVVAHHDDYAKPEAIRWLCRVCHSRWHRINGPGANRELTHRYNKAPKEFRDGPGRTRKVGTTTREREMLALRAGGWTLEAIGQKYNLTRERVRQLIGTAYKPKQKKETAFDRCMEVLAAWESGATKQEIMDEFSLTQAQIAEYNFPNRPKRISHGTANGYNRGCRCEQCVAARRAHCRASQGKRNKRLRDAGLCIRCGKPSVMWRCVDCKPSDTPEDQRLERAERLRAVWAKRKGMYEKAQGGKP